MVAWRSKQLDGRALTFGAILVGVQADLPAAAAQLFERSVALLLVGFGVRAIYQGARRVSAHPTHSHGRARAFSPFGIDRSTVARPVLVGAVHGLAGSGAMTALVVTMLPSTATQLAYLLLGVRSTLGWRRCRGSWAGPSPALEPIACSCGRFTGRRMRLDGTRPVVGYTLIEPLSSRPARRGRPRQWRIAYADDCLSFRKNRDITAIGARRVDRCPLVSPGVASGRILFDRHTTFEPRLREDAHDGKRAQLALSGAWKGS